MKIFKFVNYCFLVIPIVLISACGGAGEIATSNTSSTITSSKASSANSAKTSSLATSSTSSKLSSSSSSADAIHSTTLGWIPPSQRENGASLLPSEIGGYSIRFTSQTSGAVTTQYVSGGDSIRTTVSNLIGAYTFEIATIDTTGLYSAYTLMGIK